MNKEELILEGEEILSLIHPISISFLKNENIKEDGISNENLPKLKNWIRKVRLFSLITNNNKIFEELNSLLIFDQHNRVNKENLQYALDMIKIL